MASAGICGDGLPRKGVSGKSYMPKVVAELGAEGFFAVMCTESSSSLDRFVLSNFSSAPLNSTGISLSQPFIRCTPMETCSGSFLPFLYIPHPPMPLVSYASSNISGQNLSPLGRKKVFWKLVKGVKFNMDTVSVDPTLTCKKFLEPGKFVAYVCPWQWQGFFTLKTLTM